MAKKDLVDNLITNSESWEEDDREMLMEQDEDRLKRWTEKFVSNDTEDKEDDVEGPLAVSDPKKVAEAAKKGAEDIAPKDDDAAPSANEKDVTVEEYIAQAPEGLRDMLNSALSTHNEERQRLIQTIVANEKNTFTPQQLEAATTDFLKSVAALAQAEEKVEEDLSPVALFNGAAGTPAPTNNGSKEEPLGLPTLMETA